jgi:hypothetical protein
MEARVSEWHLFRCWSAYRIDILASRRTASRKTPFDETPEDLLPNPANVSGHSASTSP